MFEEAFIFNGSNDLIMFACTHRRYKVIRENNATGIYAHLFRERYFHIF